MLDGARAGYRTECCCRNHDSPQSSFFVSDYNPSELLVVCESIIEDGELTYDELYKLAEWRGNIEKRVSVGQAIFL